MEPFELTSGFKEGQEPVDQESIVFEISIQFCLTVFVSAQQQSVTPQICQYKPRVISGDVSVVFAPENCSGFGETRQHETVPCGQNFSFALGLDPPFTHLNTHLRPT